jgi:transcriptional regulator with XRE-family HTH domain
MESAPVIHRARQRAGLSLRGLARRANTSHSALAAYEAGRVTPTVDTLDRVVRAAGFTLGPELTRTIDATDAERSAELIEVLELAALFPARHDLELPYPIFGTT